MERSTGSVSSSDYEYSEGERKSDYEISNDEIQKLVEKSVEVKEEAYAPYSTFKVGAALLTDKGEIFTGFSTFCSRRSDLMLVLFSRLQCRE